MGNDFIFLLPEDLCTAPVQLQYQGIADIVDLALRWLDYRRTHKSATRKSTYTPEFHISSWLTPWWTWSYNGATMELLWSCYGFTMELLWSYYGVTLELLWSYYDLLWTYYVVNWMIGSLFISRITDINYFEYSLSDKMKGTVFNKLSKWFLIWLTWEYFRIATPSSTSN